MLPSAAFQASARGGEIPATATARRGPGTIDLFQQLLPFGLPVAEATIEQRPRHHDAPVATFAADADIGELRIEDHPAKLSRSACIAAWASRGPDSVIACTVTIG